MINEPLLAMGASERAAKVMSAWWQRAQTVLPIQRKASERRNQKRKETYLAHLDTADDDVLRVSLADKVHNARAILRDLRKPDVGETIWSRFSQPREKTLWYYRGPADKFRKRWPGQLADELSKLSKCWRMVLERVKSGPQRASE